MKIIDQLHSGKTLSFEVFPPKQEKPIEPLLETLEKLYALKPDFISCTYGAMGSNKGRNLEVVSSIQRGRKSEALSHYTCVGNRKQDVLQALEAYDAAGVQNILALRGDFPERVGVVDEDLSCAITGALRLDRKAAAG